MAERVAITLRLAGDLLDRVRTVARAEGSSVNALLQRAAEKEVETLEQDAARALRLEHRQRIAERLGGPLPDSTSLVRRLREGGRHAFDDEADLPGQ